MPLPFKAFNESRGGWRGLPDISLELVVLFDSEITPAFTNNKGIMCHKMQTFGSARFVHEKPIGSIVLQNAGNAFYKVQISLKIFPKGNSLGPL